MNHSIRLAKLFGLTLSARPSALISATLLLAALTAAGMLAFRLPFFTALAGGLLAVALHYASDVVHHLGHAWAARRTGYPMTGVRFWTLFGTSLYPSGEPDLPPAVHIRRALGGPLFSAILTAFAALLAVLLRPSGGLLWYVSLFFFLDNLLIFFLGAFLPLGFTDGSTLLSQWKQGRRGRYL